MNKYVFQIETSLMCNLNCPECAIGGHSISREQKYMKYEDYKTIADKIRPYASYIYLHIWGEPLLNPDIFNIIKYTSTFAHSNISTNGMCVTQELADKLILSGVTDVIVSIDGVSSEVYGKYRIGGNVAKAFAALNMLNDSNVKHGNKVNIIPQYIVFKHNQHEVDEFRSICQSLGLNPYFKAPYIRNKDYFQVPDDPIYVRPHFSELSDLKKAMTHCKSFVGGGFILVDGSVVACCSDYDGVTSFGNILKQEFNEIRSTDKFKEFEKNINSGNIPQFCIDNCMSWSLDSSPRNDTRVSGLISLIKAIIHKYIK